jgi:hypothetical protein
MQRVRWSWFDGHAWSELVIRGLRHSIRFKLGAARDEGEHSLHRGQCRSRVLALTVILEPMLLLYEPCAVKAARTVRRGVVGNVPSGNALATYSTNDLWGGDLPGGKPQGDKSMSQSRACPKAFTAWPHCPAYHGEAALPNLTSNGESHTRRCT